MNLEALGAQYREAKAAAIEHLQRQAVAEVAVQVWLKAHRGVPVEMIYDRETGEPLDPELRALEDAVERTQADVAWCRGLVIACGEAYKGRSLDELVTLAED